MNTEKHMIWVENWPVLNLTAAEWGAAVADKLEKRAKDRGDTVLLRDDHRVVLETTRSYGQFVRSYRTIAPYGLSCSDSLYGRRGLAYVAVKAMIAQGCVQGWAGTAALGWHGMDQRDTPGYTYNGVELDINDTGVHPKLIYISQTMYRMSQVDFNFWSVLQRDPDSALLAYEDLAIQSQYGEQISDTLHREIFDSKIRKYTDDEIFTGVKMALKTARRNLDIWIRSPYAKSESEIKKIAEIWIFRPGRGILQDLQAKKRHGAATADWVEKT